MEQWAAVVADSLLLAVTLAGGIWTLLRAQQISRRATLLAAAACLTLIGWMLYQLVWWLLTVPAAHSDAEIAAGAGHSSIGTVLTGVVVSIAVALLFAAVNTGSDQPAAAPGAAARAAAVGRAAPAQANGYGQHPPAGAHSGGPPATAGWTPPQQAHPNDWNIMSGVWSIPRGTFDGPPPDDSARR
jgi:hypothetical protein